MTNPTLQTAGTLTLALKLDWNASRYHFSNPALLRGMTISFSDIVYGPHNLPPPAWVQNTQYQLPADLNVNSFGSLAPQTNGVATQSGYKLITQILDMSTNAVVPGKTYALATNLLNYRGSLNDHWIQLYVLLTGSDVGTTVMPGFGLYNLGKNPNAWTYVTPTEFTGEWEIGLLSPVSVGIVWLSVEYAPPKIYLNGASAEARLIFSVSGGDWGGASSSDGLNLSLNDDASGKPIQWKNMAPQDVHSRSDRYIMCDIHGNALRSQSEKFD